MAAAAGLTGAVVVVLAGGDTYAPLGNPDPGVLTSVAVVGVRFLADAAGVVTAGALAFAAFVVPRATGSGEKLTADAYAAVRTAAGATLVWLVAAVAMVPLSAADAASEHPVAAAIARGAGAGLPEVSGFRALVGAGARGEVDGHAVLVGSAALMAETGHTVPAAAEGWLPEVEADGAAGVLVSVDGVVAGGLAVRDTVRPSAAAAVERLHRLGLRTVLLTGGRPAAAHAVAAEVGITEVAAEVRPEDKAAAVERLRAEGRRVAVVGDGLNDGPALASADLAMAMALGTDVAVQAADVVLVRDDLTTVPDAIVLAERTLRTIRGNLVWAFGYNVAALPLAALGLLNPLIAGAAMSLSSLLVVTNSQRLRGFRPPGQNDEQGE